MKSLHLLVAVLLLSLSAFGQAHSAPALDTNNIFSGTNTFSSQVTIARFVLGETVTVVLLPIVPYLNEVLIVSDAADSSSCTVGGGTTRLLCQWSGSSWIVVAGGGGGGGGGGSGTVSANNGAAGAFAFYAAAAGSTTVTPSTRLNEASNTLTYSGSGGIVATFQMTTPALNGSGTGGYKLVSGGAALPSTPGAGNNGIFSGSDGWYLSFQNDAWTKILRKGEVTPSDLNTSGALIGASQLNTSNSGDTLSGVYPTSASFGNCPIYLGYTQAGGPQCAGLAQNSVSAATYTVLTTDLLDTDVYTGTTDSTWTLPSPTGGFVAPFAFYAQNRSLTGGRILLTPAGSTIDGNASLIIAPGTWAFIYAVGANWASLATSPAGGDAIIQ